MLDLEIEAKRWMKTNKVDFTNERHIALTDLLIRVEEDAINRGFKDGLRRPTW